MSESHVNLVGGTFVGNVFKRILTDRGYSGALGVEGVQGSWCVLGKR